MVNDQSRDRTAEIVRGMASRFPHVQLLEAEEPPPGWVGKNNAVTVGARRAMSGWLLFVDADVVLQDGAAARALQIAKQNMAALVSFSPEQITETWYEKAPASLCVLPTGEAIFVCGSE